MARSYYLFDARQVENGADAIHDAYMRQLIPVDVAYSQLRELAMADSKESRMRFAEYFATIATDDEARKKWGSYLKQLQKEAEHNQ